ncbi:MAG TPA: hypothetical protein ENJ82_04170 [Bacteroidetes bacterium]|nr:hypothetical protein [Bacteroidota bacterium]
MKRSLLTLILTALLLPLAITSCTQAGSGEKIHIGLNPKAGDSSKLHYSTKQTVSQKMMGMSIDIEQVTELFIHQEVVEKDADGLSKIRVTYERVIFSQDNAMVGKTAYDSKTVKPNEQIPPSAVGYATMIGNSFSMYINEKGEVQKVEGVRDLFANMLAQMDSAEGTAVMADQIKAAFGPEAMKRNMQQLVAIFPDAEIGIGDTWQDKIDMAGEFGLKMENTYELESIKEDAFVLQLKSVISTAKDAKLDMGGGMDIEYDLKGSQEGTMEMNRASGMLIRSSVVQKIDGIVKAGGMDVPMSMESINTVEPY